jgi:hypothetical protein
LRSLVTFFPAPHRYLTRFRLSIPTDKEKGNLIELPPPNLSAQLIPFLINGDS